MSVGGKQHLGVAVGLERITRRAELVAQGAKVVDRAVENQVEPAVGSRHRLVAVRRVEDREPTHAEGRGPLRHNAVVIGSAVQHGRTHPVDGCGAGLGGIKRTDETGYAAHGGFRGKLRPVTSGAE